jgi:hypothetical protein
MTPEPSPDNLQTLWQRQDTEDFRMTPQHIHLLIGQLARKTRRRTIGGYVVCALVALACVWWLIQFDNALQRTGTLMTLLGIGTLVVQLRAHGRPLLAGTRQRDERPSREHAATGEIVSLAFLRGELERQRDFHRGQPLLRRMLPLISGPLLFCAGFAQAHPEIAGPIAAQAVLILVLTVVAFPLNRWLAKRYQRQLDALARIEEGTP